MTKAIKGPDLSDIMTGRPFNVLATTEEGGHVTMTAIKGKDANGKWRYVAYRDGIAGKQSTALPPTVKDALKVSGLDPNGYDVAAVKEAEVFPAASDNAPPPDPKTWAEVSDMDKATGEKAAKEFAAVLTAKADKDKGAREANVAVAQTFATIRDSFQHKAAFGLWWQHVKGDASGPLAGLLGAEERGKNYPANLSFYARVAALPDLLGAIPPGIVTASSVRAEVEKARKALASAMVAQGEGEEYPAPAFYPYLPETEDGETPEWPQNRAVRYKAILSAVAKEGAAVFPPEAMPFECEDVAQELARLHLDNWGGPVPVFDGVEVNKAKDAPAGVLTGEGRDELASAIARAISARATTVQMARDKARAAKVAEPAAALIAAARVKPFAEWEAVEQARHLFAILAALAVPTKGEDGKTDGYTPDSLADMRGVLSFMDGWQTALENGTALLDGVLSGEASGDADKDEQEAEDAADAVDF